MRNGNFKDNLKDAGIYLIIFGLSIIGFGYIFTENSRNRVRQTQLELQYPKEYWLAKKAEEEANIEKHRIDVESQERLTLDSRKRNDLKIANQLAFEKDAPKEYWEYKKSQEIEQNRLNIERERLKSEERISKAHNDTIRKSAESVERAVKNIQFYS